MELDAEVDARLPGALDRQGDGRDRPTAARSQARVDEPKGDPGNTLSRAEIEDKALRLAAFSGARDGGRDARALPRAWTLADAPAVGALLAPAELSERAAQGSRSSRSRTAAAGPALRLHIQQ